MYQTKSNNNRSSYYDPVSLYQEMLDRILLIDIKSAPSELILSEINKFNKIRKLHSNNVEAKNLEKIIIDYILK